MIKENIWDNLCKKWDSYEIGDELYYTGLYWDCFTPNINLTIKGKILEKLDNNFMLVDFGGNIQRVGRCELDTKPRGY